MDVRGVFSRLLTPPDQGPCSLGEAEAEDVFTGLLEGRWEEPQIAAMLALLQARGPTVDELVGGARAMRRFVTVVPCRGETQGQLGPVIDTCGTGGAPKTFNISTASAIVTAAAGGPSVVRVAKHGNRSRSGRGSAEVLGALGVNVDASHEVQARCLDELGVCFCFAIHAHPAMKHASGVRRSLAFPTIFNLLGPLTNPARASRQVIGVYGRTEAEKVAAALARLGATRAMVVHGFDGMDEITTRDRTHVFEVAGGVMTPTSIDVLDLGVSRPPQGALETRDLAHSVEIVRGVIEGDARASTSARDIVLVNAGAALVVSGAAKSIREGMNAAASAIDSGAAKELLTRLVDYSKA